MKTKRLQLYPLSDEQMEQMIKKQTIPELKAAYSEMLTGCKNHPKQRVWYALWNIELKDAANTIIGNLSFKGLSKDGILEIGYGMNKKFENQGYMTESVTAVLKWAAMQDGVMQIEAETEPDNAASKRVLEKTGFRANGIIGEEGPRYRWERKSGC